MIEDSLFEKKWLEPGNRQSIEVECGKYLYNFIMDNKIKLVVETGICQGFSSWCILQALKETEGMLFSIEPHLYDENHLIVEQEAYHRWAIIRNFSTRILDKVLYYLGHVDLFWHDSDHSHVVQAFEFNEAKKYSTFIGAHNIDYSTAWEELKSEIKHEVIIEKQSQRNVWGLLKCL